MVNDNQAWLSLRLEENGHGGFKLVDERTGKVVRLNGVEADALTLNTAGAIQRELEARREVPLPR